MKEILFEIIFRHQDTSVLSPIAGLNGILKNKSYGLNLKYYSDI